MLLTETRTSCGRKTLPNAKRRSALHGMLVDGPRNGPLRLRMRKGGEIPNWAILYNTQFLPTPSGVCILGSLRRCPPT